MKKTPQALIYFAIIISFFSLLFFLTAAGVGFEILVAFTLTALFALFVIVWRRSKRKAEHEIYRFKKEFDLLPSETAFLEKSETPDRQENADG